MLSGVFPHRFCVVMVHLLSWLGGFGRRIEVFWGLWIRVWLGVGAIWSIRELFFCLCGALVDPCKGKEL